MDLKRTKQQSGKKSFFLFQRSRTSKGILKNDSTDLSIKDPTSSAMVGASSPKKVSMLDQGMNKPNTKWRRICKCFIGLKMTKKTKV